jgi:ribosome-binding factor A
VALLTPPNPAGFLLGGPTWQEHIHATQTQSPNRSFRVADQIQRDLAELIRELKDPRIGMVTINAVEVTPDYAHAKVLFSLLVGDPVATEAGAQRGRRLRATACSSACHPHRADAAFQVRPTTERAADMNALIQQANATRAKDD